MSKKKRTDREDRPTPGGKPGADVPVAIPAPPESGPVDPKFYTWTWYAKIYGACFLIAAILFSAFVYYMKTTSRHYTEDGIAMYKMAKELQQQKTRDMDTVAGELAALDAVVDIETLKGFLLSDVAYKPTVTEDTKAYLRQEAEKYATLIDHLREVRAFDDVQKKILDKTIDKISQIHSCLKEIISISDMEYEPRNRRVISLDKKISEMGWYSMIAAGFFSWPAALDAAERSFFEALRYWQQNPEATYWWGKVLEETAINDVAAEKKIMAIKFDPNSKLADQILNEFKQTFDGDTNSLRAMYNYAFALYRKGRIDDAMPIFHKVYDKDRALNSFEAFLAKRRIDIVDRKIDMKWSKTDDF